MDTSLTVPQVRVYETAREVAAELADRAFTWQGDWPFESARLLAEHELLALSLPEDCGGLGLDPIYPAIVMEAVAEVCPDSAQAVRLTNFGPANHIARLGSEDQRRRFVTPMARGETVVAIAMSEAEAGSAANSLVTTARDVGGRIVIEGGKLFCSMADVADVFLVYARFPDGVGTVLVERGTPGLELVGMDVNMWGGRQGHLRFHECVVPAENALSRGKEAFAQEFRMYNMGRLGTAAMSIAAAHCALQHAVEYVRVRRQFGSPISDFQGIRWMIAEMTTQLEAARAITYRGLANATARTRTTSRTESSLAKVFATKMAHEVVDGCLQLFGATGFMRGTATEYLYRFIRGNEISGGTSQVQKNIIADAVLRDGVPSPVTAL